MSNAQDAMSKWTFYIRSMETGNDRTPACNFTLLGALVRFHKDSTPEHGERLMEEMRNGDAELFVLTSRKMTDGAPPFSEDELVRMVMEGGMVMRLIKAAITADMDEAAIHITEPGTYLSRIRSADLMRLCDEGGLIGLILDAGRSTETVMGRMGADLMGPMIAIAPDQWNPKPRAAKEGPPELRAERRERFKGRRGE